MQCEYCSKVYNRESNLKYHQKNDKECLQRQAKPIPKHTCMYCEKNYTAKTLQRHMIKCNSKNEYYVKQELLSLTNELRQKDEEIKKMRDVLKIVERFRDEFLMEQEKGHKSISLYNDSVRLMEEMMKPKIVNKEELTSQNIENQEEEEEEKEEIVYVIEDEE